MNLGMNKQQDGLIRIAMWSGPRNISTAMMRSWENRSDTVVVDEPLYGPYLATTGKKHAAYEDIIKIQGAQWQPIVKTLTETWPQANHLPQPILDDEFDLNSSQAIFDSHVSRSMAGAQSVNKNPSKSPNIYYQKHMSHHLTDDIALEFVDHLQNAFLIRHPEEVVASYLRKHHRATASDLGYPQQVKLFNWIKQRTGKTPPIFESKDVLQDPEGMLKKMCQSLNVPFDSAMLSWPKGYRDSDGVWAEHWYNRVIESTGFAAYKSKENNLSSAEQQIADTCLPYYETLLSHKLKVE